MLYLCFKILKIKSKQAKIIFSRFLVCDGKNIWVFKGYELVPLKICNYITSEIKNTYQDQIRDYLCQKNYL